MSQKANVLKVKIEEAKGLLEKIDEEGNREKYAGLMTEIKTLKTDVEAEAELKSFDSFLNEPASEPKAVEAKSANYQPAQVTERNERRPQTLGEAFVNADSYKSMIQGGKPRQGTQAVVEAKGFLGSPSGVKATFDSTDTGLTSGLPYVGGIVMVEQQRLTIRDLMAVGQTTLNSIPYIKETSFTNAATTVAEEGLKPEATFATEDDTAPVRKIAVIGRVTDEMFADFPMMRDYVNQRLRFMVEQTEENQLLNGAGTGSTIKGILNTTGIQTQAIGTDSLADAVFKAITKIRTVGFFEPDGIVIHPNDYQALRLAKDANEQYYGGGYFSGAYGVGGVPQNPPLWGLKTVVTTAISEGDPLVGSFRMGAQIWQREGITVATTDTDGEDWRYNRIAVRVEERLALTVYRPKAFCQVITA